MNPLIQKLTNFSETINNFNGEAVLFAAVRRIDFDEKWDLVFSAKDIKGENEKEDLTSFIKLLRVAIGEDINFIADILLLPTTNNIVLDIAASIKKYNISLPYNGELKISELITIKEINLLIINIESLVTRTTSVKKKVEKKVEKMENIVFD